MGIAGSGGDIGPGNAASIGKAKVPVRPFCQVCQAVLMALPIAKVYLSCMGLSLGPKSRIKGSSGGAKTPLGVS